MTGLKKQRNKAMEEYERVNHILDIIKRRATHAERKFSECAAVIPVDVLDEFTAIRRIAAMAVEGANVSEIADKLRELENVGNVEATEPAR